MSSRRSDGGLLGEYGLTAGCLLVGIAVVCALFGLRALPPILVPAPLVTLVGVVGFLILGAWSGRMLSRDLSREDLVAYTLGAFVVPAAGIVLLVRALLIPAFAFPALWTPVALGLVIVVGFVLLLALRADRYETETTARPDPGAL